jgi:hypothetical protein
MKIYYTTTAGTGETQKDNYLSLGGYRSGTQVPNNRLNNLFGDITPTTIKNYQQPMYIALIVENDTASAIADIMFHFEYGTGDDTPDSKYEIAAIDLATDTDGELYMENVQDIYTQPYTGTFSEADGASNAVNIGDISANGYIGIWIRRTIDKDKIDEDCAGLIEQSGDIYIQNELGTQDSINLVFNW